MIFITEGNRLRSDHWAAMCARSSGLLLRGKPLNCWATKKVVYENEEFNLQAALNIEDDMTTWCWQQGKYRHRCRCRSACTSAF